MMLNVKPTMPKSVFIDNIEFELVKFVPDDDHVHQKDSYMLRPVEVLTKSLNSMTKAQLIEYIKKTKP